MYEQTDRDCAHAMRAAREVQSAALGGLTLFSVGVFKGHLAARPLFASGLEFFVIAVGAAGLGYLIGLSVQYFFPGVTAPMG